MDPVSGVLGAEDPALNAVAEAGLTLSTIHQAKGLEWRAVFLAGLVASPPLSASDPQEQRRLVHVAVTRAKTDLYLLVPGALGTESPQPPSPHVVALRSTPGLVDTVRVRRDRA